ncbi:hypothetical protein Anapl_07776 [Anas platyrhynchos]|uniref:Uncharacterized protein n=1 Tax=Anas platyrhynchos TaxID=8839 RepID=R0JDF3_ANAPL|nr:hypothetical protein Anapl_07776 [Anas platyrhynchos]
MVPSSQPLPPQSRCAPATCPAANIQHQCQAAARDSHVADFHCICTAWNRIASDTSLLCQAPFFPTCNPTRCVARWESGERSDLLSPLPTSPATHHHGSADKHRFFALESGNNLTRPVVFRHCS